MMTCHCRNARPRWLLTVALLLMYRSAIRTAMAGYTVVERGAANTLDYRLFYVNKEGKPVSPWHDISLYADEPSRTYNMVVEVPRWTNAKMEIATAEKLNPIKQDVKKGALRYVHNIFPHKGYIWNYGALPQTWEDPGHVDVDTNAAGDNDPIDACEIGGRVAERGEVIQVKVLGTLALIDEGETDWKLIVIDVNNPLCQQLNDIQDVEAHMPGLLRATVEWFRNYKIPAGKPPNVFGFGGQYKDRAYAHKVIDETHGFWLKLIADAAQQKLATENVSVDGSVNRVADDEANRIVESTAAPDVAAPITDTNAQAWQFIVDDKAKSNL